MTLAPNWKAAPFWSLYKRGKKTGFPTEELLSVYRDYGVIKKSDRDDNWNRPGEDLSAYQLVNAGDLVLNKMKTWQGSLGVSSHRGIVSPAYFVYKSQSPNDPRFLHYALRSDHYIKIYASISKGVRPNQWDLQPEQLDAMHVLIPDLTAQQRIADYLDRETGEIDAMIAKLDQLARALDVRRRATIESVLGAFPKHRLRLAIALSQTGPFGTQLSAKEYVSGGVPLINPTHIRNSQIHPDDTISVTKQKSAELSRHLLKPGDIVLGRKGEVDKAALVSSALGRAICGSDSMIIRTNSEICDARFLWWYFQSPNCHQQLRRLAVGAAVEGLNQAAIAQLWMPLPSTLKEQKRIADHLDEVTSRIDAMLAKVTELNSLLTERRKALITDVVTGRMEVA